MKQQGIRHRSGLHRRLLVFAVWLLVCLPATSNAQSDVSGAVDHPALQRFPGSWIIDYRRDNNVNYLLALGMMRREGGRVVPENSVRVHGNVLRITYEIPPAFTVTDAIEFFREQTVRRGYAQLFACTGRDCGNSNYWANDVFGNRALYGTERSQYYLAADLGSDLRERYLSLYIVTRGNQRNYAHVEIIEADKREEANAAAPSSDNLQRLQQQGSLRLDQLGFGSDDQLLLSEGLGAIAELLNNNPSLTVYVVAHLRQPGDLADLLQRSQRRAAAVRAELMTLGVDGLRIIAQGVGPLVPRCSEGNCDERVELVLQP